MPPRKPGLTTKQRRFVAEYLKDANATQAAVRAGYGRKSAGEVGYQLLQKTPVTAELERRQKKMSDKLAISAERVLAEYARLAFSNMGDFVEFGPKGAKIKELAELSEDDKRCVAEVAENPGQHGSSLRFKLHSKTAALEALAKHLGLFAADNTGAAPMVVMGDLYTDAEVRLVEQKLLAGEYDDDEDEENAAV